MGGRRLLVAALALALASSACLGTDTPAPTGTPAATSASPATSAPTGPGSPLPAPVGTSPDGGGIAPTPGADAGTPVAASSPSSEPFTPAEPSVAPTRAPDAAEAALAEDRDERTLVIMAPEHPRRLLPPAANATERLLVELLYDPLYRLDEELRPVPELARQLPTMSEDGRTWEVPIRSDARFHDGTEVTPADVMFSLRLAAAPTCPLGTDLCAAVREHMAGDPDKRNNVVIITLDEPYAPFLTEALGRLPILSERAVTAATDSLIEAADKVNEGRPDNVVNAIRDDILRAACSDPEPPAGCRLADHLETLERIFSRANLELPSRVPFTDDTGDFNDDGYAGELLERLNALGQVFTTSAEDELAAALGLLDATARPMGGGPYRLHDFEDGVYHLRANREHTGGPPGIERIDIVVERDPSVAVGQLLAGNADWVLEVGPEQHDLVTDVPGVSAAYRPLSVQRGILFNVRPGRVYDDTAARRAFDLCLDRAELGREVEDDRFLATTPYTATSWALPETAPRPRDVDEAIAILEKAGWKLATDGVRVKGDERLSSTIAVRPSNVDLFTFANEAASQLRDCGIELIVEELDLTGDTMLTQLLWPNDFDTMLVSRPLGPDPDSAVRAFESSRITTAENAADANPSGFISQLADHLIAEARAQTDEAARAEAYAQVQELLVEGVPYWPLWYDTAMSAISTRVQGPDGPIDPSRPRYDWDVASWTLARSGGASR